MRWPLLLLALTVAAIGLAGCCGSRTVTVEVPTRDAVNQTPPDTTLRTVPLALDTTGAPTLPVAVEVNVSADTSATACVTAIVQTDSTIEIRTPTGSQTFRSPDCGSGQVATYTPRPAYRDRTGETPDGAAPEASGASASGAAAPDVVPWPLGGTAFDARVSGAPKPREVTVTCPACPRPVIGSGLVGWLKVLLLVAVAFGAGYVVRGLRN